MYSPEERRAELQRLYRMRLRERAHSAVGSICIFCGTDQEVQMAHVKSTNLCGKGRGLDRRYLDVIQNPDCYRPMCEEHHRAFDLGEIRLSEAKYNYVEEIDREGVSEPQGFDF